MNSFYPILTKYHSSTHEGNAGGVRHIKKKELHGMSIKRTFSIQEAVHIVDNQDLVICSKKFTYLSLHHSAMLTSKNRARTRKMFSQYIGVVSRALTTLLWMNISASDSVNRCSTSKAIKLRQPSITKRNIC